MSFSSELYNAPFQGRLNKGRTLHISTQHGPTETSEISVSLLLHVFHLIIFQTKLNDVILQPAITCQQKTHSPIGPKSECITVVNLDFLI